MRGRPKISPARVKLTITVMSMPRWARVASGGRQHVPSLAKTSAMVFTCDDCAGAGASPTSQNPATHIKNRW
jgi:hypothetical protein